MKPSLTAHLETMDHEISGHDTALSQQGYRVDGDSGIKLTIGLNNRKSVDYFFLIDDRCVFLEFSDLAREQEDLIGIQDAIEAAPTNLIKNKLKKLVKQSPRNDMVLKFKDSFHIFSQVQQHYENPLEPFEDTGPKTFFIVYAPVNDELPEVEKAEITRFLRTLKSAISDSLEDEICNRVKLILLNDFAVNY
jgi:hypothetical protein